MEQLHCNENFAFCQQITAQFLAAEAYTIKKRLLKGGGAMRECDDRSVDLDDLIFDEDDGGPSER